MTALYRFMSVFLLLPSLLLAGCGSDSTEDVSSLTVTTSNNSLDIGFPERFIVITATVTDADGEVLPNATVQFSTNLGSFSATGTVVTASRETGRGGSNDAGAGVASIQLYPGNTAGSAVVTVYVNGLQETATVTIAGTTVPATLSLEKGSGSLDTASAQSAIDLTAKVQDAAQRLLANSSVTFTTTLGSFSPTTRVLTTTAVTGQGDKLGLATVKLYPDTSPGTATVTASTNNLQATTQVVITGANLATPVASSVVLTAGTSSLFVTDAGDGFQSSTTLSIQLLTASNLPARDAATGINNLRVSLLAKPNGGEIISGTNAANQAVQSNSAIEVNSTNGVATITLKAGTLPGVVQLAVEALNDQGLSFNPALKSSSIAVSIASGPAHTIAVTYPQNGMTNLGNGLYRRAGTLAVTDRYGNAVTDGTLLNLGIVDSVISSNRVTDPDPAKNPTTTNGSATLSDPVAGGFLTDSILRSNISRFIEVSDRVLILNSQLKDRSRFVAALPTREDQLTVNKAYQASAQNLNYIVGASLLGTQISGVVNGTTVSGRTATTAGAAAFFLTYPANRQNILTGCIDPSIDTRHQPAGSAEIWLVAESEDGNVVAIDNSECLVAIEPFSLTNESNSTLAGSGIVRIRLRDLGNVELPFLTITPSVTSRAGTMNIVFGNCVGRSDLRTNEFGVCDLPIIISGGNSGDTAQITISSSEATPLQISVQL
ncbi:MAG: hypothetical protein K2W88_10825 [Pararheinheimera sp.]|nr:hypothetical protein [Rheinheimera sp.]